MNSFIYIFFLFIVLHLFSIILAKETFIIDEKENNYNYKYPVCKKMRSGNIMIILNKGIYIYDNSQLRIQNVNYFQGNVTIDSNVDNEKTVISEYIDDSNNDYYTLCLIKGKYLFIFKNESLTNNYELNITNNDILGYYYNLIPYKNKNNANQFLISFISKEINKRNDTEKELFLYYSLYIKFFLYDFDGLYTPPINFNHTIYGIKYFTDYYLSCQIISNEEVICFYKNSYAYLTAAVLNITNNLNKKMLYNSTIKSPYFIKTCISEDKNNIFITYKNNKNTSLYAIYDNVRNTFIEKNNIQSFSDCEKTDIQFFNETNEYIFFCKNKNNDIIVLKINKSFAQEKKAKISLSDCQEVNSISIYYSENENDYNLITDCKLSEKDEWNIYIYKSIFTANKYDLNSVLSKITTYGEINEEVIVENLQEIINAIEIGETYEEKEDGFTLVIKPTNASYLEDSTHVNFIECENILRRTYNIPSSSIITFLQLEIKSDNDLSLSNKVEYQVYDDQRNLLDLSICNNSNIQIFFAIKKNIVDINQISEFKELGVDIFNLNDSFFNDICHPYSDKNNNDIVLEDRIKYIYQNYSVCDEGCSYNDFNTTYMTIKCDCKVKTNISLEEAEVNLEQYDKIEIDSNFDLIKCYDLVFSLEGKLNNYGFMLFLSFVLIHIPLVSTIGCKGIKPIENYILDEMTKHGYIKKQLSNKKLIKKRKTKKSKIHCPPKYKDKKTINTNNGKKNVKIGDSSSINKVKNSESDIMDFINPKKNNISSQKEIIIKPSTKTSKKGKKKKKGTRNKDKLLLTKKTTKSSTKLTNHNIDVLPTQTIDKDKKINKNIDNKGTKGKKHFKYNLININLDDIKDTTPETSYVILNNYTFEEAEVYDFRSVVEILYIFLLSKQEIFHAFLFRTPLVSFPLRLCLLMFIICSDLALNAIFYLDDKISEKYKYTKSLFLFAFSNNFTIILLSTFIGFIFMTLFTNLSNSTYNIREIFKKEEMKLKHNKKYVVTDERKNEIVNEIQKILKKHKIKVIILLVIEFLIVLFFWYYVTAFCHVFSSTQTSWLLDSFLSMVSRFCVVLVFSLGFAKLYRISVESHTKCIYKFVLFFYSFG